jgi:hypothetical protein
MFTASPLTATGTPTLATAIPAATATPTLATAIPVATATPTETKGIATAAATKGTTATTKGIATAATKGTTATIKGTATAATEGTATAITGYNRKSDRYRGDAANKWRSVQKLLPFEIVRVLVCFNHIACVIVNADHGITQAAAKLRVSDSVRNFRVPQATEWQRIGEQIDARLKIRNGAAVLCRRPCVKLL